MNLIALFLGTVAMGFVCGLLVSLPRIGKMVTILAFVITAWVYMENPSTLLSSQIDYLWYEWIIYLTGLMSGYYMGKEAMKALLQEWNIVV